MRSRALLLVLLLVTTGCLTARSQSADTPDATGWSSPNSSAMGAGPSEPVDPQDPRRVGGEAEAHAGDPLVSVALPLVVVNDEGPGREVMLQDPWGRPHARIACEH
ncbi:MAG: hypothetical protein R3185_09420, partial [Candidatus Thermoplasmatota archaeon]|nr:hypothetical protein [Candidatus Thermoplasmatota archaeon]